MESSKAPRRDLFTSLPNEILSLITDYLSFSGLLKLRLLLGKTHPLFVQSVLEGRMSRLYVSPDTTSMHNFKGICSSAFFQPHISEVVFVPNTLGRATGEIGSLAKYRQRCFPEVKTNDKVAVRSYNIYRKLVGKLQPCFRLEDGQGGFTLATACKLLMQGLSLLQTLETVAVKPEIDAQGLNACSMWYGREYAVDYKGDSPHTESQCTASRDAVTKARDLLLEQGHQVFMKAVGRSSISVKTLQLGATSDTPYSGIDIFGDPSIQIVAPKLTSLTISGDNTMPSVGFKLGWPSFISAATNLTSLTVYYNGPAYTTPHQQHIPLRSMTDETIFRSEPHGIRHFEIVGSAKRPAGFSGASLQSFLMRQKASLRTVILDGVILADYRGFDPVRHTMAGFLRDAHSRLDLDHFSVRLYRRDEHLSCENDRCDGFCTKYLVDCYGWVDRAEFEVLASQMGVTPEDGFWDFAKVASGLL